MSSMLSKKNTERAIYGYVRNVEINSMLYNNVPNAIKDIIIEYFKYIFNWKDSTHGSYLTFLDDNIAQIKSTRQQWIFLTMKHVLSIDELIETCVCFEWEIKMKTINTNGNFIAFMIGFVEHPAETSIDKYNHRYFGSNYDTQKYQFGVYVSSLYTVFRKYGKHGNHIPVEKGNDKPWQSGDRFKLKIDFTNKQIQLYYNDEFIGILYKDIPNKLVPTVAFYSPIEMSCTLFQLQ
eukprot:25286_1